MLFPVALDEFFEVLAGVHNVFPEGVDGNFGIARAAGLEKFAMRLSGEMQVAREDEMQPRVAVAIVVHSFQEAEHDGPFGGSVQSRVELPVPFAP